ncbi:hypothetical protein K0504_08160 [Neiella marina]|uniref:Uncharacterized protein n=1 Tax=Neiella holothuriorum TaxID=2870530 RepID=A0ABS7EGT7_9GAMM|nr:hypothetical protein [Neiella holothuriorum]MBW8191006.1 hypothetical protein [Neiella holothuriorum]
MNSQQQNRINRSGRRLVTLLSVAALSLLQACSPPEKLEQLQVEFPQPEQMKVDVQSDQRAYQFSLPAEQLNTPAELQASLASLPDELRAEVLAMLEHVEAPPPAPIPGKLSRSVDALDHLLKSLGKDLNELQQDLAENTDEYQRKLEQNMGQLNDEAVALAKQAEQHTSEFLGKMKHEYVNHIAEMIKDGELTPEQIEQLEQAIATHRQQQP